MDYERLRAINNRTLILELMWAVRCISYAVEAASAQPIGVMNRVRDRLDNIQENIFLEERKARMAMSEHGEDQSK